MAARELMALGHRRIDWYGVCKDLWKVLGERTELKELLVERLLHSQRFKIKSRVWDDDLATDFGRDQYLGNYSQSGNPATECSYIGHPVPAFDEQSSPRIHRLEDRLVEICPDWEWFNDKIQYGWLCAPKAFRFFERILWAIGRERRLQEGEDIPGFLCCQDTYLNQDEAKKWWGLFCTSLRDWWRGKTEQSKVAVEVSQRLGEATQVKRWLVRLLIRKLELLERHAELKRLVHPQPYSKRGTISLG